MAYTDPPPPDEPDDPSDADGTGAWDGWMDPKTEAELFQRDLAIEEKIRQRQERALNALLRQDELEAQKRDAVRSAERTWETIKAGMPTYRYVIVNRKD